MQICSRTQGLLKPSGLLGTTVRAGGFSSSSRGRQRACCGSRSSWWPLWQCSRRREGRRTPPQSPAKSSGVGLTCQLPAACHSQSPPHLAAGGPPGSDSPSRHVHPDVVHGSCSPSGREVVLHPMEHGAKVLRLFQSCNHAEGLCLEGAAADHVRVVPQKVACSLSVVEQVLVHKQQEPSTLRAVPQWLSDP